MTAPLTEDGCPFCTNGYTDAGRHKLVGPLIRPCLVCRPCRSCEQRAVYPKSAHCLLCFIADLAVEGLEPIFCGECAGMVFLALRLPSDGPL